MPKYCKFQCKKLGRAVKAYNGIILNKTVSYVCEHTSLAGLYPDIAKQWNYEMNGCITPDTVPSKSNHTFSWKCLIAIDHVWQTSPANRINSGSNCPCCVGQKVVLSNCLVTTHPDIAKQWHPDNKITAYDITFGSGYIARWKCPVANDHIWEAAVCHRTAGSGCPCCTGQKVVLSNCLVTTHKEIAEEWSLLNVITPYEITYAAHYVAFWNCPKNIYHVYRAWMHDRTINGSGCPRCKRSKGEEACENILIKHHILYDIQYSIDSLLRKHYDFIVNNYNVMILIEFDGIQHFIFNWRFHSNDYDIFIKRQDDDREKTWGCIGEGYKIIRLSYKTLSENSLEYHILYGIQLLTTSIQVHYFSHPEDYQYLWE